MKDIIRFYKTGKNRLIHVNITEEQAKEWCGSLFTRKENVYFDGFAETGTYCHNQTVKYNHYFEPTKEDN